MTLGFSFGVSPGTLALPLPSGGHMPPLLQGLGPRPARCPREGRLCRRHAPGPREVSLAGCHVLCLSLRAPEARKVEAAKGTRRRGRADSEPGPEGGSLGGGALPGRRARAHGPGRQVPQLAVSKRTSQREFEPKAVYPLFMTWKITCSPKFEVS